MTTGPGKYDEVATIVMTATQAKAVIVVVFDGVYGDGFSAQILGGSKVLEMPYILRQIADQIEKDAKQLKPKKGKRNVPNG